MELVIFFKDGQSAGELHFSSVSVQNEVGEGEDGVDLDAKFSQDFNLKFKQQTVNQIILINKSLIANFCCCNNQI